MASAFVEARPKGRAEGTAVEDYVVEDHMNSVLGTFATQKEAIDWAKAHDYTPHVARVRHLNDKNDIGQWRAV